MKKSIIIFSLLVSMMVSLFPTTALAQQSGDHNAIYIYRNDGDFNAFLNCDVDSINYSTIDLNGQEHPYVVVQEVRANDSIYRIPIDAIDSVAFSVPAPVFKSDLFHLTEEHLPYVQTVSDLAVDFDLSIPSSMLPHEGQVVVSDVDDDPFDGGFAGKVISIDTLPDRIHMECDEASIEDIYDELVCVGKSIGYSEDDSTVVQLRAIDKSGVKVFTIRKQTLPIINDGNGSVTLNVTPSVELNYAIYYKINSSKNYFKVAVKPTMNCSLDYNWSKSASKSYTVDLAKIKIETSVPLLFANIKFGGFLDLNGSVSLNGKLPFTVSATGGYDSTKPKGQRFYSSKSLTVQSPEGSVTFSGSAHVGLSVGVGVSLVTDSIASAYITLKAGPRLSGTIQFDTKTSVTQTFYNSFKNSYISLEPLVGSLEASVHTIFTGTERKTLFTGSLLGKKDYYLFPLFTAPHLPSLNSTGYSLTSLTTEPSRNLIFKIYPGIKLSNSSKTYTEYSSKAYKKQADWNNTNLQMELNNKTVGTYTAVPVFKIFGATITASPSSSITIHKAFTLSSTNVCVKRGSTKTVTINDGWGSYSISNSNISVCTTTLNNSARTITIKGVKNGTANVTVKDKRSGKTQTIKVIVNDTGNTPSITVSTTSLSLGSVAKGRLTSKTFTVKGSNLTGNLSLSSSNSYFTVSPTTITKANAANNVTVTVYYRPTTTGSHSGFITIKDGDAVSKTVKVTGTATGTSNPNEPVVMIGLVEPDDESDDVKPELVNGGEIVVGGEEDVSMETLDVFSTGVNEMASNSRIYAEGQVIIIESVVAQNAVISDISGHTRSVSLQEGRNEIPVNASGIYIVRMRDKTAKLMLK